jgi:hypothetical protein
MNLELERKPKESLPDRCIGGFYIDGQFAYYSLEDTDRKVEEGGIKIPGKTAIPRGRYKVTISFSNRFQRLMPHILDVPLFTGIRIHAGNTPENAEGCPLIGMEYDAPSHEIRKSKLAFDDFFPKLEAGLKEGEVWIEIR